jgi:Domain of unknown function (DUF6894)
MGRFMERYFFTIRGRDPIGDDREVRYLPDVASALSYAEHSIRELRKKSECIDLTQTMVVQDQARRTILFLPFSPAPKVRHGRVRSRVNVDGRWQRRNL